MPVPSSRLSLIRTDRWRPEYELREDGRPLGTLAWTGHGATAEACVGDRVWTLRPGGAGADLEACEADDRVEATLRDGSISFAGPDPDVRWCRNRTPGCCAELTAPGSTARLRTRHRTAPGLDVAVDGELHHRELVVLLAGYALLR
jgi:hypothetical protein